MVKVLTPGKIKLDGSRDTLKMASSTVPVPTHGRMACNTLVLGIKINNKVYLNTLDQKWSQGMAYGIKAKE